jgi:hypothetical protein
LDEVIPDYVKTCAAAIIQRAKRLPYEEPLGMFISKYPQYKDAEIEAILAVHEREMKAIIQAAEQAREVLATGKADSCSYRGVNFSDSGISEKTPLLEQEPDKGKSSVLTQRVRVK